MRRHRYGLYEVGSASQAGVTYTVTTDGAEGWTCSCPAGEAGRPACWHRAAVLVAKVEAKGARVTGPAAPVAPAPKVRKPRKEVALV